MVTTRPNAGSDGRSSAVALKYAMSRGVPAYMKEMRNCEPAVTRPQSRRVQAVGSGLKRPGVLSLVGRALGHWHGFPAKRLLCKRLILAVSKIASRR